MFKLAPEVLYDFKDLSKMFMHQHISLCLDVFFFHMLLFEVIVYVIKIVDRDAVCLLNIENMYPS